MIGFLMLRNVFHVPKVGNQRIPLDIVAGNSEVHQNMY